MAWTPPTAGELRQSKVRFERQGPGENVGGVVRESWLAVASPRSCRLLPLRGGEQIQAARLSGLSAWELVLRADRQILALTTDDRVRVVRHKSLPTGAALALRSMLDLQGDGRWLVMTLELGTEDGQQT